MINEIDSFKLEFPRESGFDSTNIHFYSGTPDLVSLYLEKKSAVNRLFVTDETIASLDCMKAFVSHFTASVSRTSFVAGNDVLLVLGSGEPYKTIDSVLEIVKTGIENNFNRNCVFVGIGGGVITDMTGFAASIFKRGVECEFVSTTLLADVDASVGGKTGCDFGSFKNMIGAFYPSRELHVWPSFVNTLSDKEYISGLAEAIKTAFLFSQDMVEMFRTRKEDVLARDEKVLGKIIAECTKAKAAIVHEDLREHGRRAFLNLGHSFGHALEAVAGLGKITHGEGVAWGMARAADFAAKNGFCSAEFASAVKEILAGYGYDVNPVPAVLRDRADATRLLLNAMHKDKKNMEAATSKIILQKGPQDTFIFSATDEMLMEVLG